MARSYSGQGFVVKKYSTGNYTVKFLDSSHYLSATADLFDDAAYDTDRNDISAVAYGSDRFICHISDSGGKLVDKSFVFTAIVRAARGQSSVPVNLEGYYAISGVLNADGSIASSDTAQAKSFSCSDYSVEKEATGTYVISLQNHAQFVSTTANFIGQDQNAQGVISVSRDMNSRFVLKTSGANVASEDKPVVFTAIVNYPDDGSMPDNPDNRFPMIGVVDSYGEVERGTGFYLENQDEKDIEQDVGIYKISLRDTARQILSVTASMVSHKDSILGGVTISKIDGSHFEYRAYGVDGTTLEDMPAVFTIIVK